MNEPTVSRAAARLLALVCVLVACACGCGSKDAAAGNCAGDPFACPTGQTCWPVDARGAFACLPSKDFVSKGDECELLPGRTACRDDMICLTSDSAPDAHAPRSYCAPFCDPSRSDRGCTGGDTCERVALFSGAASATTVRACVEHDFTPKDMSPGN